MASNVVQTVESAKTPQLNEIEHFAQITEQFLDSARQSQIPTFNLGGEMYEIVENPFIRGILLSVHTAINDRGKEVSFFPMIVLGDDGDRTLCVPEIFLEKAKRLVLRYSSDPEGRLTGYSVSDFKSFVWPEGQLGFTERMITYTLDRGEGVVKPTELAIMQYLKRQFSKRRMYTLNRAVKNNTDHTMERLFLNVSTSVSNGVYLVKNDRNNLEKANGNLVPYTFYRSASPVVIMKPIPRGELVTLGTEIETFGAVVETLRKDSTFEPYITPTDRRELNFLHKEGISLPIFED